MDTCLASAQGQDQWNDAVDERRSWSDRLPITLKWFASLADDLQIEGRDNHFIWSGRLSPVERVLSCKLSPRESSGWHSCIKARCTRGVVGFAQ